VTNPDFDPEKIKVASTACEGLCRWLLAIEKYDVVAKVVAPKRIALKAAEDTLAIAMNKLEAKREILRQVQGELKKLQDNLDTNKKKKVIDSDR
jgi:dynein heavy chain